MHYRPKIYNNLNQFLHNVRHLACRLGQWRSIREGKAIDANGKPIPWYTYPAIEYLESFCFKDCDVFEFGSGNSSRYWARRSRTVTSVESDREWFRLVDGGKDSNQLVLLRPDESGYTSSVVEQKKLYDVIVVDGAWRDGCVRTAVDCLKPHGIIVLDNSDRKKELECGGYLRAEGFFQIDFSGFGPINGYTWTTSIFIQKNFTIQEVFRGPCPVGGLGN